MIWGCWAHPCWAGETLVRERWTKNSCVPCAVDKGLSGLVWTYLLEGNPKGSHARTGMRAASHQGMADKTWSTRRLAQTGATDPHMLNMIGFHHHEHRSITSTPIISHQLSAVFGTLVLSQVFENGHTRHSVRLSASTAWGEHGCQAGLAATRTKHDKHIMARLPCQSVLRRHQHVKSSHIKYVTWLQHEYSWQIGDDP
jgi:hypothetical protein